MTENAIAPFERRRSRPPTSSEPIMKQVIGGRLLVPCGDRRDGAQSVRVETQEDRAKRQHDVMCVLVLRNNMRDLNARLLFSHPTHQVGESMTLAERSFDGGKQPNLDGVDRPYRDCSHKELYEDRPETVSWLTYNAKS